jgi:hypothetical protein
MRSTLLVALGVGIGFVAAHQFNKTPQGRQLFEDVRTRAQEFGDAVADGYRAREAELEDTAPRS